MPSQIKDIELNIEPIYRKSGIVIAPHSDISVLEDLIGLIQSHFIESNEVYGMMEVGDYREIVFELQEKLCKLEFNRKIAGTIKEAIQEQINEEDFFIQTNTYLRAARPNAYNPSIEAIGWHRETFYGPNMERSCNIWTPLLNVVPENTLRFIPESQIIPDEAIITTQHDEESTPKGSASHKIGYLYSPKTIISGVDLDLSREMIVPNFASSIFPGNLIHGAGLNKSNNIRFSTDFRILPKSAYDINKNKQYHLASDQTYFELF